MHAFQIFNNIARGEGNPEVQWKAYLRLHGAAKLRAVLREPYPILRSYHGKSKSVGPCCPKKDLLFDWSRNVKETKRKHLAAMREQFGAATKMCGECKNSFPRGKETQVIPAHTGKIFQFWKQTQWGPDKVKTGQQRTCLACLHALRITKIMTANNKGGTHLP